MLPATLVYGYAPRDEPLRAGLDAYLNLLQRQGFLAAWSAARTISETEDILEGADVVLLLVSADFLASGFCRGDELERVMRRHESGEARVIPILLRPCDWESCLLGERQALPANGRPVTLWKSPDEAWLSIAQGLRRELPPVRSSERSAVTPASGSTIHVGREHQSFGGPLDIVVKLDGEPEVIVPVGTSWSFVVAPGVHALQAVAHNGTHRFESTVFKDSFESGTARWFDCHFPRGWGVVDDLRLSLFKASTRKLAFRETPPRVF